MMRQYIMCKAGNTPLYVFGDDTAGDEQYRKCNDGNALRDYATENSACYRDTPPGVDKDTSHWELTLVGRACKSISVYLH
jgi:hypothetical protein